MDRFSPDDYRSFQEEDFINDPYFQQWIVQPTEETDNFWRHFLEANPAKQGVVQQARTFLLQIRFEVDPLDEARAKELFRHHLAVLEAEEPSAARTAIRPVYRLMRVAALAGGVVVMIAALLFFARNRRQEVATQYGELKTIILPDSSFAVLNAHSNIRYNEHWKKDKPREVWLEGEAFFQIRHLNRSAGIIQPYERFYVHTNHMDIAVLGTSFDIRQRRGKTEVVLQTGKIEVSLNNHTPIILKPGDLLVYDPAGSSMQRSTTQPEDYTAWKEKKLVLTNPSVHEIIAYLEDNYGKKIVLQDAGMGKEVIEGPLMLNSLDDALFILSAVLNTRVVKQNGRIILVPKK